MAPDRRLGVLRAQVDDIAGLISDEMTLAVVEKDELIVPRNLVPGASRDTRDLPLVTSLASWQRPDRCRYEIRRIVGKSRTWMTIDRTAPKVEDWSSVFDWGLRWSGVRSGFFVSPWSL
jgi:hypothetical protein